LVLAVKEVLEVVIVVFLQAQVAAAEAVLPIPTIYL
jgi:hypothetical protein